MNTQPITDINSLIDWDLGVISSKDLVHILFYSKSSKPSLEMFQIIGDLSNKYKDINFFSVDVDNNPTITWKYRVSIVPTMMMFKNGQKLSEQITLKSTEDIESVILNYLH